jgi:predicted alpha/beta-fold hydrolase
MTMPHLTERSAAPRPGAPRVRHDVARAGVRKRRHGRIAGSTFEPHPLLRNPHLQTMFGELLRTPEVEIRHERLELPDGDFVDLGWCGAQHSRAPIAILVHGIAGSFRSHYVRGMARALVERGWRAVILQLRGSGNEPNRMTRLYHHGDTDDFHYLCRLLREAEPQTPLAAIGWSLGANVVLKAAGEARQRSVLSAVAAASAPFRLEACAAHLRTGAARIYQLPMLKHMKRILHTKHVRNSVPLPDGVDIKRVLEAPDFLALADCYTAPMTGHRDATDYCASMECGRYLAQIRRPTLIVHGLDDPFMVPGIVPDATELAPSVRLEISPTGGHVGFVAAGEWGQPEFWLERRIPEFLDAALQRSWLCPRQEPPMRLETAQAV